MFTKREGVRASTIVLSIGVAVFAVEFLRRLSKGKVRDMISATKGEAIDVQKTITIQAPVETVFAFWDHYENFPRTMSHVKEVKKLDATHSRWKAEGPMGVSVEWDAVVTKRVPNQLLAWESLPGSIIDNAGSVRFTQRPEGLTRVDIQLVYHPPAGELGHHIASWFGSDPMNAMDEDLRRVKSLLEGRKESAYGDRLDSTMAQSR